MLTPKHFRYVRCHILYTLKMLHRLPTTVIMALLILAAIGIPILVFKLSQSHGKQLTYKARAINDTSYLSIFYQNQYRNLDELNRYLKDLVKSYSFFCQLLTAGYTSKKGELAQNPIYMLKISSGFPKPIVLLIGGIYANDWLSATSILYLANQLLSNCTSEGALITMYDWYLIPILNPDGYNFSHSKPAAKTWIKNIAQWSMDFVGVNLNYNFDYFWQKNYNFRTSTYPGVKPFSETESLTLRSLVLDLQDYVEIVMIFISPIGKAPKKPAITFPWSYTKKKSSNWVLMEYLGLAGAKAAKAATGTQYKVVQSGRHADQQTGRIDDWIHACSRIDKVLTVQTDYVANLVYDPYESITKMGTETFAIVRTVADTVFQVPQSYRKNHMRININKVVTIRPPHKVLPYEENSCRALY